MIRAIHFPGLTALPLHVASARELFAKQKIDVRLTVAENSRQLMIGVLSDDYDVGQAAIDNVIAYQERQASPDLDVERDLIGIMATSSTNLDLVVQPDVLSYADLKGKTLGVDALTTGFAFVLRKILECGGLKENEYNLIAVGGDTARLAALGKAEIAGALLAKDFASHAAKSGLRRLSESRQILGDYQGTSFFARRSWAEANRPELVSFVRALREAHVWLFDPGNNAEAAAILVDQNVGMESLTAAALVRQLTTGTGDLSRTGSFSLDGLGTVLALRSQYGVPKKEFADPSRYVDTSFLDSA